MLYRGYDHKQKFNVALKSFPFPTNQMHNDFLCALFLITADNRLWQRAKRSITFNHIDFSKIILTGLGINGYTLCKCAEDLYSGTSYAELTDIGDSEIIDRKIYSVIKSALQMKRDGMRAIK